MRNVTIGGIVDFTINVTIEGFIDKKSVECRFVWLRKNGQVIDVCTIHINYPVRFFITDRLLSENEFRFLCRSDFMIIHIRQYKCQLCMVFLKLTVHDGYRFFYFVQHGVAVHEDLRRCLVDVAAV